MILVDLWTWNSNEKVFDITNGWKGKERYCVNKEKEYVEIVPKSWKMNGSIYRYVYFFSYLIMLLDFFPDYDGNGCQTWQDSVFSFRFLSFTLIEYFYVLFIVISFI